MKKESLIAKKKTVYDISKLIKNIGVISSITGESCLVNIKTHEIIGSFNKYRTVYDDEKNFYFQEKKVEQEKIDCYKEDTYVNIYDVENEKYIIENYKYIKGDYNCGVFQNPKTKKLHLFDIGIIRNENNIFKEEFDSIETILNEYYGIYIVVEQNGKKGVYKKGIGLITSIEYDDIKRIKKTQKVMFEKGGQSYFAFHHVSDGIIESPLFDSMESDLIYSDILYCKIENNIVIYDLDEYRTKLLCKFPMVDEIKCLSNPKGGRNIFLVKKNGKYGLYGFDDDKRNKYDDIESPTYIEIVPPIYDKIEEKNYNYFLYKDGKVGLYTRYQKKYSYTDFIIEPKYDEIEEIKGTYLLFFNDKCDIVTLDKIEEPHVANCEYVENYSDNIVYKIDGKYGIYIPINDEINIINGMDNIVYKSIFYSQNLYIIEENGKQGIIYNGKILIAPIYESVIIYGVNEGKYKSADFYYFKLNNDKNKLAKFFQENSWSNFELMIQDAEYDDIEFYQDIMLLDNGQEAALYDYKENLLKTLAAKTKIQCIKLNKNNQNIIVYNIDGIDYFYKNGILEKAFIEDYDLYVTSYETSTDSFEVSTHNKIEHDEFCLSIDSQSDEDAEKSLLEMSSNLQNIRGKYPTLVLTRVNKLNKYCN